MAAVLVIGYGNSLRNDDGLGIVAAQAVEQAALPNVEVRGLFQLTPELAESLATVDLVIFIDVRVGVGEVEVLELEPRATSSSLTHFGDPRVLLALTESVYGRRPRAVLITAPATQLDFGEELSPQAAAHVITIRDRVVRLVADENRTN